jgi:hypothetical protein
MLDPSASRLEEVDVEQWSNISWGWLFSFEIRALEKASRWLSE